MSEQWTYYIGKRRYSCSQEELESVVAKFFLRRRLKIKAPGSATACSPTESLQCLRFCFNPFIRRMWPIMAMSGLVALLYGVDSILGYVHRDHLNYADAFLSAMALTGAGVLGYGIVQARRQSSDILAQIRLLEMFQGLSAGDTSGSITLTIVICGIFATCMAIVQITGLSYDDLLEGLALAPEQVFRGQVYRLVSGVLMHANLHHLMVNVVGVCALGSLVEVNYSTRMFWRVVVISALSGAMGMILLSVHQASVGISGAIFGLAFFLVAVSFKRKHAVPIISRMSILCGMLLALFLSVVYRDQYDLYSHAFGAAAGLTLGLWYCQMPSRLSDWGQTPSGQLSQLPD